MERWWDGNVIWSAGSGRTPWGDTRPQAGGQQVPRPSRRLVLVVVRGEQQANVAGAAARPRGQQTGGSADSEWLLRMRRVV